MQEEVQRERAIIIQQMMTYLRASNMMDMSHTQKFMQGTQSLHSLT